MIEYIKDNLGKRVFKVGVDTMVITFVRLYVFSTKTFSKTSTRVISLGFITSKQLVQI